MFNRRTSETDTQYLERLFRNRSSYNLSWDDVSSLYAKELGITYSGEHLRKMSYGFLHAIDLSQTSQFDNSVLVLSDIHVPFERKDVLEILRKHNNEIDTVIINGDFLDNYAISIFPKLETLQFQDELIYGYEFLREIRKILNRGQKIIFTEGNHEDRFKKQIMMMNDKNLQQFINPNILEHFVDGFTLHIPTKKVFAPIENVEISPNRWYVNHKGLIACHPLNYSNVKGKILEQATQYFVNKGEQFDVVVIAHTHKIGSGVIDRHSGKFAIESGCLCQPMEYAERGVLTYTPQGYGYVLAKWNNSEGINPNNVRHYILQ